MELPSESKEDYLYWKHHQSGRYSVKTGYYFLCKDQVIDNFSFSTKSENFTKIIWRLNILPKWKIVLWKLIHDGLAVKVNLTHRGIAINAMCDFCELDMEDSQHLFRFYSLAKAVWENSPMTFCHDMTGFPSLRSWIQHFILLFYSEDGKHSARITRLIATLWGLWLARNKRIFNRDEITIATTTELVNIALKEHEVFTGGTTDKSSTRAGIGWATSGHNQSHTFDGGGRYGTASSALHCETWACLEAIKWVIYQGKEEVLILSDSALLLENLRSERGHDISIVWMIEDIRTKAAHLRICIISKVKRDQVQQANDIAKKCRCTLSNLVL
ncbi:uncharacterized protein LOC110708105 [Chenopodium quinoa]|uniref:uncharacterized protein LOC110708105 n=1 Tax=Chenopodium quinoa TaxID=63459 RepID=UPI000B794119|nr:uncharacterized protein LOC110708105 [Chenopodium quinoa]